MLSRPRLGKITQGTVFTAAVADEYRGHPVWGIVITARCDTAHGKTRYLNYVPVVRLEDWILREGGLVLMERLLEDCKNRFVTLLESKGLNGSLIQVHSPLHVAETHFPAPAMQKTKRAEKETKDASTARGLAERIQSLSQDLMSNAINIPSAQALIGREPKFAEAIVKDLVNKKFTSFYFLPSLGDETEFPSSHGYVTLVREVRRIPARITARLAKGIAADERDVGQAEDLSFDTFDFALPIAQIQSPWIEHFMQTFSSTFSRIGVADPEKEHLSRALKALQVNEGAKA